MFKLILDLQLICDSRLHHLLSLCVYFPFPKGTTCHGSEHLNSHPIWLFQDLLSARTHVYKDWSPEREGSKERRSPLALTPPPAHCPLLHWGLCMAWGKHTAGTQCSVLSPSFRPLTLNFTGASGPDSTDWRTDNSDGGQTAVMMEVDRLSCRLLRDPLLINYCFCDVRYEHPWSSEKLKSGEFN